MRVGIGYDVHRLITGRKLILGGVEIPFNKGLLGHSDADVLVHAIGDALLGAAALGDLGQHFPDSDSQYMGISSLVILEKIMTLVQKQNYRLVNVDSIVIAQEPKLSPYIQQMRNKIAQVLKMSVECVAVKATTTERLGFTGTGEGIAAEAIVLIEG